MRSWFERSTTGESGHVSDEELLRLTDGELSPGRQEQVRGHLEACWSCRSRSQKMQSAITEFAALRRETDAGVRPPKGWREFPIRLEQLDNEAEPRGFVHRMLAAVPAPGSWASVRLVVSVVVVCGLLLWFWGARAPVVYAKELLTRAKTVESLGLLEIAEPWFYQRLSVEKQGAPAGGNVTATLEVWSRVGSEDVESRGQHLLWEDLRRIARANGLEGLPLLSAEAFERWREGAGRIEEDVRSIRLPGGEEAYALTAKVLEQAGDWRIREGRLVVRASDWRPMRLSWTIAAGGVVQTYHLTIVESRIVSGDSLPSFVTSLQQASAVLPAPSARAGRLDVPPAEPKPSSRELDAIELRARYALHRRGDCLLGNVRVQRTGVGRISVNGLVETTEDKEALLLVLPQSPWLDADLKSIEQLERATPIPPVEDLPPLTVGTSEASELPIEKLLLEYFSERSGDSGTEVTRFLEDTVRQAQAVRREAWALRHLAERYTGNEAEDLPGPERTMLVTMVRDHANQIRALSERNEAMLGPFLFWVSGRLELPPTEAPATVDGAANWNVTALSLARRADRFDDLARDLFAGGSPGSLPLARALAELAAVTGGAQLESSRLAQIANSDFLAARQLATSGKIE